MILQYNLRFFAASGQGGEKTEPATGKKLSEARRKGQVAKSREVGNAMMILALFLILKFWLGRMGIQFLEVFHAIYNRIPEASKSWNGFLPQNDMLLLYREMLFQVIYLIAPIIAIGFVVAFICDLVQVKWRPTTKPLMPKFSKLNPISGFKKIFSINAIVELIKSIAKLGLILYVVYGYLQDKWHYLYLLYNMPLMQAIQLAGEVVVEMGIRIALVYMIIALADYIYQRVKFKKDMRMTKQEVKDEYKQQEGDPQVKGKIRQKMREVSQRRMMQSLPQADVVITNPTHYAVAVQYDPEVADAPVVLAKGEDYLAQKIKEAAKEHNIEIVENKPLARMLYANVEVGGQVPPELYQAVAEVLAFVYHLKGKI